MTGLEIPHPSGLFQLLLGGEGLQLPRQPGLGMLKETRPPESGHIRAADTLLQCHPGPTPTWEQHDAILHHKHLAYSGWGSSF